MFMTKGHRFLLICSILAVLAGLFSGCKSEDKGTKAETITSIEQLNSPEYTIGMNESTGEDKVVAQKLPQAQIVYYSNPVTGYTAVAQGKLDAYVYGKTSMETSIKNGQQGVRLLDETLGESYTMAAAISPKTEIPDLENKINEFIDEIDEDGTRYNMQNRWIINGDTTMPKIDVPETSDIHIVVGTSGVYEPYTYYVGKELRGYDIELAYRFAQWLGATIEFNVYNYDGLIAALEVGDVDCVFAAMFATPERKEVISFSQPTFIEEIGIMVQDAEAAKPELAEFSDLSGKTVSMLTGAPFEELVKSKAPDVGEFTFFNSTPDMIQALKTHKTDAFLMNNAVGQLALNRNPDLVLFPQSLKDGEFGIAFSKGDSRRDEWQAAYDELSSSDVEAAWYKWTGADESVKVLPEQVWEGANGTVKVAVCDTLEPMSYVGGDGELRGFDLEIILMMAEKLDVKVEFTGMEFSAILAAVQSGKADMGAGSIIITEERAQAVDFVEYYPAAFELIVRASSDTEASSSELGSFIDNIKVSFNKTFIREGRWKLFVDGVTTTMIITLLSLLLGTILGFSVLMICRNGNPVANAVTRFCFWLVRGMPMVVLLMILFYIVFGDISISGIAVAVIGFTLSFGASVYGLLKIGVGAIDNGQYEAAYALGYSNRRTFFKIIFPQAIPHVLPAYKGEIVGLIKATAIVGYIAVQDLTKMGDIVRSRTYEAFFPLIAVTIIYFVLEGIIGLIIRGISIKLNPKLRSASDILKGVKTDD